MTVIITFPGDWPVGGWLEELELKLVLQVGFDLGLGKILLVHIFLFPL
jgi:hypothetical protein